MARTRVFNPFALRSDIKKGKASDYDYAGAKEVGMTPDKTGHYGSLGRGGKVLKGRGHESFTQTIAAEDNRGNKVIFKKGRYRSVPKKKEKR
jgi:hypothetical protein